jgi:KDO2-lipid IV(A) lauroyltransferase
MDTVVTRKYAPITGSNTIRKKAVMKVRKKKRGWKRVTWEVRYWLASVGLRGIPYALRPIPMSWVISFIDGIGLKIAWRFATKYKKKMLDNLTATYHQSLAGEEKERIARESLSTMLRGFIETFYCVSFYEKKFDPWIDLEGREHLERALALRRGVIGVSAHLGTFTLIGAKLHVSGFHLTWIMGGQPHPRLAQVWRAMGEKVGAGFITIDSLVTFHKAILRSLRKGDVVGFICDENQKQGGVLVEFLGRTMALPVGPAVYHLKTKAPILPLFIIRQRDRQHKVIIAPPLKFQLSGDEERDIFIITSQISRAMESYIKRYPGQWSWISKRRIRTRTRRKTLLEEEVSPLS